MKELPYYRFTVSEWLQGDINMESYNVKGVFIDVCSWYWFKDCSVDIALLKKRFSDASSEISQLIDSGIIKILDNQMVEISFLDIQFDLLSEKRQNFVKAGRKGGLKRASNAKATLKQRSSYKDKDKDKDNNKEKEFKERVKGKCLMKNSGVTLSTIEEAFSKSDDLMFADAKYYYNSALAWSDSGGNMRIDWIATVSNFARRDMRDQKLKIRKKTREEIEKPPENYGVPSPTAVPMPDRIKKTIANIGKA